MKAEPAESCGPVELWAQMVRTQRAMDRALAAVVAAEGLTIPQTEILAMLGKAGPLPQQALAQGLCVTKGNVAQVVDRLHRAGLLSRTEIAGNRRANMLAITPAGRAKVGRVLPAFKAFLGGLLAGIPAARRAALLEDLAALERSAGGPG